MFGGTEGYDRFGEHSFSSSRTPRPHRKAPRMSAESSVLAQLAYGRGGEEAFKSSRLEKLMASRSARIIDEQGLARNSPSGDGDGSQHATVVLLVEMSFGATGKKSLSLQHDGSKYEAYLEKLRADLSGTIVSPHASEHTIDVVVRGTPPADAHQHDAALLGSRLGAFEVYLCTELPSVETVWPGRRHRHALICHTHTLRTEGSCIGHPCTPFS